jgi:hypothetical protein
LSGLGWLAALDGALIVAALLAVALSLRASLRRRQQWYRPSSPPPSQPDRTADELAAKRERRERLNVQPLPKREPDDWGFGEWRG